MVQRMGLFPDPQEQDDRPRCQLAGIQVRPTTRVLLLISEPRVHKQSLKLTQEQLRDHLGHASLYLQ
jgi:hypothetical protein